MSHFSKTGIRHEANPVPKKKKMNPHEKKYMELIKACKSGHTERVSSLLKSGVDVDYKDCYRDTALIISCRLGCMKIASVLLINGANVNIRDNHGNTPLWIVCSRGDVKLAEMLLQYRANINIACSNDWTPLMEACSHGYIKIVSTLLLYNADIDLRGNFGYTALDIANIFKKKETAILVEKHRRIPKSLKNIVSESLDKRTRDVGRRIAGTEVFKTLTTKNDGKTEREKFFRSINKKNSRFQI